EFRWKLGAHVAAHSLVREKRTRINPDSVILYRWSLISKEEPDMTAPTRAREWIWPADVLTFAAEHGLAPYLEPVLEMTRRLFPGRAIATEVTADYEIPDERYITVWVNVTGLTVEQLGAAEDAWYAQLRQLCSRKNESLFYLGVEGN